MPATAKSDIIRHSVEHLRALICRTKTHTDRVTLEPDFYDVRALFEQLIHETPHAPALTLEVARVRRCAAFLRQNPYPWKR